MWLAPSSPPSAQRAPTTPGPSPSPVLQGRRGEVPGDAGAAPRAGVDPQRAADSGDAVGEVGEPRSPRRGGRIEPGSVVLDGEGDAAVVLVEGDRHAWCLARVLRGVLQAFHAAEV